jgi:hypothetical protein
VRAARKAIATSPDHPDGYYFLAKAYSDSAYYVDEDLQELVVTASLGRVRARLPDDPSQRRPTIDVLDLCQQLDFLHTKHRRLDLLFDVTLLSITYLKDDVSFLESEMGRFTGETRERMQKDLEAKQKELDARERAVKVGREELGRSTDKYINQSAAMSSPLDRAALARQYGLIQQAVSELEKAHQQFQKQLGDSSKKFSSEELALQLAVHAELIELMLYVGRVEEAAQILDALDTPDTMALMGTEAVRLAYFNVRQRALGIMFQGRPPRTRFDLFPAEHYRTIRQGVAICIGDFERAVEVQTREAQVATRELDSFRDLNFPNGLPKTTGLMDPFDARLDDRSRAELINFAMFTRALLSPVNPVPAYLGGLGQALGWSVHLNKVGQLLDRSAGRVNAHMRLALTFLEQGDAKSAAHYFKQALKATDFPNPLPNQRLAQSYLQAIERATGGRGTSP